MRDRNEVLHDLVSCLNSQGFEGSYAVVHGVDPEGRLGRDVDIHTPLSMRGKHVDAICDFFKDRGVRVCHQKTPWSDVIIGFDLSDGVFSLEVDIISEHFWGWARLIRGSEAIPSQTFNDIPLACWDSFAKRVLVQFLSGNILRYNNPEKLHELCIFPHEKWSVSAQLSHIFGETKARNLELAINEKKWKWFAENRLKYGSRLLFWSLIFALPGVFRAVRLRVHAFCWGYIARQKTPDIMCVADDELQAAKFCSELKAALQECYIFSPIEIHPLDENSAVKKRKQAFRQNQRKTGLLIFYAQRGEAKIDRKDSLCLDAGQVRCKDAVLAIVEKHAALLGEL
ncbi:MAG: hypothetical protein V5783_05500 [Pontiella sp.]